MSKSKGKKTRKGDDLMKQIGYLAGVPDPDSDGDEDMMAELIRIQGGDPKSSVKPKKKTVASVNKIEKMAAAIMSDEIVDEDDDMSDADEDELMKELEGLSSEEEEMEVQPKPTKDPKAILEILEDRLKLYSEASSSSEGAKKRRIDRGVKTLKDLKKAVKAGRPIDEAEIPPEVAYEKKILNRPTPGADNAEPLPTQSTPAPIQPKPEPTPIFTPNTETHEPAAAVSKPAALAEPVTAAHPQMGMVVERKNQYHMAAIEANKSGDQMNARKFLKLKKDFERVIEAMSEGQDVDLSKMPGPPVLKAVNLIQQSPPAVPPSKPQTAASPSQQQPAGAAALSASAAASSANAAASSASAAASSAGEASGGGSFLDGLPETSQEEAQELFSAPDAPTTTLEALEQRLKKYQDSEREAKEQSNSGKARRMGRIAKQYQEAIKACKANKPYDYAELPTPPGFADIPPPGGKKTSAVAPPAAAGASAAPTLAAGGTLGVPKQPAANRSPSPNRRQQQNAPPAVSPKKVPSVKKQASLSIQEKQLELLLNRQAQYKKAALQAKNSADKELAIKYMRTIKGMTPMITAARNGLPVDMGQVPPEPASEYEVGYVVVEKEDLPALTPEERTEQFNKIKEELYNQVQKSKENSKHFSDLGDVKNSARFETEEKNCSKDLDSLKNAFTHGDPPPKYHYESRQYSTVVVNSDLGANDLEVQILKGISYPLPSDFKEKDLDTIVVFEFPFPQDEPQKVTTDYVKHTINPEYNYTTKLKIDRNSKSLKRIIGNRKLKLEIFYRRGFLKSDKQLATVNIKLDQLEAKSTYHESFDLLEANGRKECGGKLEVKLRLREPFSHKQVEVVKEKWLVIDQFVRLDLPVHKTTVPNSTAGPAPKLASIEVLRHEKKELDAKIRSLASKITPADLTKLTAKSSEIATQVDGIQQAMKSGRVSRDQYLITLKQLIPSYTSLVQSARRAGDMRKYELNKIKLNILQQEIHGMQMGIRPK